MIKQYVDFELQISSTQEEITVDINGRPHAINLPKPITIPRSCESVDWKNLALIACSDSLAVSHHGNSLYELFFVNEVRAKFEAYLNRRGPDEGVRLCICTQTNDLSKAAWEILCSQLMPNISFLALDPRTPVIRSSRIGKEVYLREMLFPLRLLVILASPRLVQRIDPIKEKLSLEQALGVAISQGQIIVDYLGFDKPNEASFDKLQTSLVNQQYDIVHIIGHGLLEAGQEGVTALVHPEDGKQQDVSASSLANLFHSRGVMLVILQSCQSGAVNSSVSGHIPQLQVTLPNSFLLSTAQQMVASGVPAVLAMQETIDQDVATHFINRLYTQWLEVGCPFEDALTQARQSVYQKFSERIISWAIPVLYMCPGVQLFLDKNKTISPVETKERLVDAALPQQVRVGKETELVVLIRLPTMPGLRESIDAQPQDYEAKPEDVRTTNKFDVSFPVDEMTGKFLPTSVKIVLETKDFDLSRSEDNVQVRPQGDSVLCRFYITPKREGPAKLLVIVLDNKVTLAQLQLRTTVQKGEAFETEYRVVDATQTSEELAMQVKQKRYRVELEKSIAAWNYEFFNAHPPRKRYRVELEKRIAALEKSIAELEIYRKAAWYYEFFNAHPPRKRYRVELEKSIAALEKSIAELIAELERYREQSMEANFQFRTELQQHEVSDAKQTSEELAMKAERDRSITELPAGELRNFYGHTQGTSCGIPLLFFIGLGLTLYIMRDGIWSLVIGIGTVIFGCYWGIAKLIKTKGSDQ
jgi:hypothetical protein